MMDIVHNLKSRISFYSIWLDKILGLSLIRLLRHLCLVSWESRQDSSWLQGSSPSWLRCHVRAPAPCLVSPAARRLTFRECACATRLFHFPSPSSASRDSPAAAAFLLCSTLLAGLCACRTPPSFRTAFGTPESSFLSRRAPAPAGTLALRNLLSFV